MRNNQTIHPFGLIQTKQSFLRRNATDSSLYFEELKDELSALKHNRKSKQFTKNILTYRKVRGKVCIFSRNLFGEFDLSFWVIEPHNLK